MKVSTNAMSITGSVIPPPEITYRNDQVVSDVQSTFAFSDVSDILYDSGLDIARASGTSSASSSSSRARCASGAWLCLIVLATTT